MIGVILKFENCERRESWKRANSSGPLYCSAPSWRMEDSPRSSKIVSRRPWFQTSSNQRITTSLFCSVAVKGWEAEDILTSWKDYGRVYRTVRPVTID